MNNAYYELLFIFYFLNKIWQLSAYYFGMLLTIELC